MIARLVSVKSKLNNFSIKLSEHYGKIQMPERFKGTVIEKWVKYWRQLGIDYADVAIDVGKDIRAKPVKAAFYGILSGALYYCYKTNPSEEDFMQKLRYYNNQVVLVHEQSTRLETANHLKDIERHINQKTFRYLSLGIISIVWNADYSSDVSLYKAICPHLQFKYLDFHNRILDVGFWNEWWILNEKFIDYDIRI